MIREYKGVVIKDQDGNYLEHIDTGEWVFNPDIRVATIYKTVEDALEIMDELREYDAHEEYEIRNITMKIDYATF